MKEKLTAQATKDGLTLTAFEVLIRVHVLPGEISSQAAPEVKQAYKDLRHLGAIELHPPIGFYVTTPLGKKWLEQICRVPIPVPPRRDIKCAVFATNSNGSPDIWFCKVRCTEEQRDVGDHYDAAKASARGTASYDCYSEDSEVLTRRGWVKWPAVMEMMDWNAITEVVEV